MSSATTSAAATPPLAAFTTFSALRMLAALATFNALARNLMLLCRGVEAGAWLLSCHRHRRWRRHCRLRGPRTDIPITLLTPLVIPAVITPITLATITIAPVAAAPLRPPALAVAASLTALGAARMPGMIATPVATPLTANMRAMGGAARRRCGRRRHLGHRRLLCGLGLAHEELLEPCANAAVGVMLRGNARRSRRRHSHRRGMRHDRRRRAR